MRYVYSSSLPCLSSGYDSSIFIMNICKGSWNHGSSEICMLIFKLVYILFHIILPCFTSSPVPMQEWATCYWKLPPMTPGSASFAWKIITLFSSNVFSSFSLTLKDKIQSCFGVGFRSFFTTLLFVKLFLDNSSQAYPFLWPQLLYFALSCCSYALIVHELVHIGNVAPCCMIVSSLVFWVWVCVP